MKFKLMRVVLFFLAVANSSVAWAVNCPVDYNAAHNNYGGFYNAPSYPNPDVFVAIKSDGSLGVWGGSNPGRLGFPTDAGYVSVVSNSSAFAALKADGSISSWGDLSGGTNPIPSDTDFVSIASTQGAFAALHEDGSISSWGHSNYGGTGAPSGFGFVSIASNESAFAAIDSNGFVSVWGNPVLLGYYADSSSSPNGGDFVSISSTKIAFAGLRNDGSIYTWGPFSMSLGTPNGTGYVSIASNESTFAALHSNGSISTWGDDGSGAPTGNNFVSISSTKEAFAALTSQGEIMTWGHSNQGGSGGPLGGGYVSISASDRAFAALRADGSITGWGADGYGGDSAYHGTGAPEGTGFESIVSGAYGFAALKSDGSIESWGFDLNNVYDTPTGTDFVSISSNANGYAALKSDGSIHTWGESDVSGAPSGTGFVSINGRGVSIDAACPQPMKLTKSLFHYGTPPDEVTENTAYTFAPVLGASIPDDTAVTYLLSNAPLWMSVDPFTGVVSGTPTSADVGFHDEISLNASNGVTSEHIGPFSVTVLSTSQVAIASVLEDSASEGGGHNTDGVAVTVSELLAIDGLNNINVAHESLYQSAISSEAEFSNPPLVEEVQVLVDAINFLSVSSADTASCPADYSAAYNDHGGYFNAQNYPALSAFAALKEDGSVSSWGSGLHGGIGAPNGNGFVSIVSNSQAFAALTADGSISVWGRENQGGSDGPTDSGYVSVVSSHSGFAALKSDGTINSWGQNNISYDGPTTGGFVSIYSNSGSFAAIKADGRIFAWGGWNVSSNGDGAVPTADGFVSISSTYDAFAALRNDGSISAWGNSANGGTGAPAGNDYVKIFSNRYAFAALSSDGSIHTWGQSSSGGTGAPAGNDFLSISASEEAFAALKPDGTISTWGNATHGGIGGPTASGNVSIITNGSAFAALRADGSINSWGVQNYGGAGSPTGGGFVSISASGAAFAALNEDGSIYVWGSDSHGGNQAPAGNNFVSIASTSNAFTALKTDGSMVGWGELFFAPNTPPTGTGFVSINNREAAIDPRCAQPHKIDASLTVAGTPGGQIFENANYTFSPVVSGVEPAGLPISYSIVNAPSWAVFDTDTGVLSGNPGTVDAGTYDDIVIGISSDFVTKEIGPFSILVQLSANNERLAAVLEDSTSPGGASNADQTAVTLGQLSSIVGIANVVNANMVDYQNAIASETTFSNLPTLTEVQSIIDSVNASNIARAAVLEDSSSTGGSSNADGTSIAVSSLLLVLGVDGVIQANELQYQDAIANESGFSNLPTAAEIQVVIDTVNTADLILSGVPSNTVVENEVFIFNPVITRSIPTSSGISFTISNLPSWASFNSTTGILGGRPSNDDVGTSSVITISASNGYKSASIGPFSITVELNASNTAIATILQNSASVGSSANADSSAITVMQLNNIDGLLDVRPENESSYQDVIANATGLSNPPSITEIQLLIDGVNASTEALTEILEDSVSFGGANNANRLAVSWEQLNAINGIEGLVASNMLGYQSGIAAEDEFYDPPEVAQIQAIVHGVNDYDGDGVSDAIEMDKDSDRDGVPNDQDLDSDNDTLTDFEEGMGDQDGDGIPNMLDLDSDNDGIADIWERQSIDSVLIGQLADDAMSIDLSFELGANGLANAMESNVDSGEIIESAPDSDGDGIADYLDRDSDNDGVIDQFEASYEQGLLSDAAGIYVTTPVLITPLNDSVGDNGVLNNVVLKSPTDSDEDGRADYRDRDSDNDGVLDVVESFGLLADADGDGALDNFTDSDNDGMDDNQSETQQNPVDTDGDGLPDQIDTDSDGDGLSDLIESGGLDSNSDGRLDNISDLDGDGVDDSIVQFPLNLADTDNDGIADYLDLDSDNDGMTDMEESGGVDLDGDGRADSLLSITEELDSDGDGVFDFLQTNTVTTNGTDENPNSGQSGSEQTNSQQPNAEQTDSVQSGSEFTGTGPSSPVQSGPESSSSEQSSSNPDSEVLVSEQTTLVESSAEQAGTDQSAAAQPLATGGSGGGCSIYTQSSASGFDPLLPGLGSLALVGLIGCRNRRKRKA